MSALTRSHNTSGGRYRNIGRTLSAVGFLSTRGFQFEDSHFPLTHVGRGTTATPHTTLFTHALPHVPPTVQNHQKLATPRQKRREISEEATKETAPQRSAQARA